MSRPVKFRAWKTFIWVSSLFILGCAHKPSNVIAVDIENTPNYLPFVKFSMRANSNIGNPTIFVAHPISHSIFEKNSEYVIMADSERYSNFILTLYLEDNGKPVALVDTLTKFDSCEVVYKVRPIHRESNLEPIFFQSEQLRVTKAWDNSCAM